MPDAANSTVADLVSQAVKDSHQATTDGSAQAAGSQTDGGLKLPEFMKGQLPEEGWAKLPPEARQTLTDYGKSLYGDYQRKTEGLAREREQLEELKGQMETTLKDALSKQASVSDVKRDAKDYFEELMSQTTDAGAREQLGKLKAGILQLTNAEAIQQKLDKVEKLLGQFVQTTQVSRTTQLQEALAKASEAFQPLAQKYARAVVELGVQYPTLSLRKLFQLVATEDEYDQAVQADGTKTTKQEHQRAKAVPATTKTAPATGTFQATDKDKITAKGAKGWYGQRWNWKTLVPQAVEDARANAPS